MGFRSRYWVISRISAAWLTRRSISSWDLPQLQGEGHVLPHGHVGIQGIALEDHGDVPVLGLYVVDLPLVDVQLPLGDVLQSGHHPQGGGLAAAGGAHQHDKLLVRDLQIEVVHRGHISIIDLKNMLQTDC